MNRWVLSPARNCPRLLFTMADHRLVNNTRITDSSQATASGSSTIWTSGPATRILSSETSAMARFSLDMRELKTINALGTLGVVSETQWLSTQAIMQELSTDSEVTFRRELGSAEILQTRPGVGEYQTHAGLKSYITVAYNCRSVCHYQAAMRTSPWSVPPAASYVFGLRPDVLVNT